MRESSEALEIDQVLPLGNPLTSLLPTSPYLRGCPQHAPASLLRPRRQRSDRAGGRRYQVRLSDAIGERLEAIARALSADLGVAILGTTVLQGLAIAFVAEHARPRLPPPDAGYWTLRLAEPLEVER